MFTDIVGYTQLMGRNEEAAIQLLRTNREIHEAIITEQGGELLKEMGDGVLASFPTISGAVHAALSIQDESKSIPGLVLRIGVHQGEILKERGDIFGDGVNIASRLQELAQPDQILVSETIYRNVRNQKGLILTSLGRQTLKNVDEKIGIYSVGSTGSPTTPGIVFSTNKNRFSRYVIWGVAAIVVLSTAIYFSVNPDRDQHVSMTEKSIAILPFKTVGDERESEYFAQGIMDVLTVSLGKLENLQVRSGTSVARFTQDSESIGGLGNKLKVQFLLEGRAQKYGDDIRVILQLYDPVADDMIWDNTYIRKYEDIFNVQSEIALDVVSALDIVISGKDRDAIEDQPTESKEAWDLYLRGRYYQLQFYKFSRIADIDFALDFYERASDKDPKFALAVSRRAEALRNKHWFEFRDKPEIKDSFLRIAQMALELDSMQAEVYLPFANYYTHQLQDPQSGIHYYKKAVELNPRSQDLLTPLAFACSRLSELTAENKHYNDSALIYAKKALKLQPGDSYEWMLRTISHSYHNYGVLDLAEIFIDACLEYAPDFLNALNHKFFLRAFQLDFDEAHLIAERSNELMSDNQGVYLLAKIFHQKGDYAEAEKYYKKLYSLPPEIHAQQHHERTSYAHVLIKNNKLEEAKRQVGIASAWILSDQDYDFAKIHLLSGDNEKALSLLESFEPWFGLDRWIAHDPVFDSLHDEPRFQAVVKRCEEWTEEKRRHVERGIREGIFPDPNNL